MNEDILFSIITPAYCGAEYLRRLSANLIKVKASYSNFEWIIVDDCSPDQGETVREIRKIQGEGLLSVQAILLSENYYNSRSIPTAATVAKGSYSIILDQDDLMEENALVIFSRYIQLHGSKTHFAGICARCVNLIGEPIGTPLPSAEIYTNETEIRHRYRIRGEMFQCTRTELIKSYFSQLNPGNTNGLAWSRIAQKFKYIYIERAARRYDTTNPNSVSNVRKVRYVSTYAQQQIEYLNYSIGYLLHDPFNLIRISIHAQRFSICSARLCGQKPGPAKLGVRLLFALIYPIARVLSYRDQQTGLVSCR